MIFGIVTEKRLREIKKEIEANVITNIRNAFDVKSDFWMSYNDNPRNVVYNLIKKVIREEKIDLINSDTEKEEFIDKIIDRINKKQLK
jgi:hypothetical protein